MAGRNAMSMALAGFRGDLARLLAIKKWSTKDLSARIGCSPRTVERMSSDPGSVRSAYTLTVLELLRQEDIKRNAV